MEDWLTKDGRIKKKDVANREKFLIDSVFTGLGIDDKLVYKMITEKIQSQHEGAVIEISLYSQEMVDEDKHLTL